MQQSVQTAGKEAFRHKKEGRMALFCILCAVLNMVYTFPPQ